MTSVVVSQASETDAAALAGVAAQTFALACPPHTTQAAIDDFIARHLSEANFQSYLADPDRVVLVAEVDGQKAGYSMLVQGQPTDPDVATSVTAAPAAELSKFYVLEGFHGAGVATVLMAATVHAAREWGSAGVWLGVNKLNQRANRFYEKSGFAVVGSKRFLVGDNWEDDYVRELVF